MKNNKETFFKDLKKLLVKYQAKELSSGVFFFENDRNKYEFYFNTTAIGGDKILHVTSLSTNVNRIRY